MKTGYRTLLVWIAILGALTSLIAYYLGQNSTTVSDVAISAGISDLALTIAIVATVGAIVLAGVENLLANLKFEVRQQHPAE